LIRAVNQKAGRLLVTLPLVGFVCFALFFSQKAAAIPYKLKAVDYLLRIQADTVAPIWPNDDSPIPDEGGNGIEIPLPANIHYGVEYNPKTGKYEISQKVGNKIDFRYPSEMNMDDFLDFQLDKNVSKYWKKIKDDKNTANKEFAPTLKVGGDGFEHLFGSNEIEIRPQGSAELIFGVNANKTENPRIPIRQRRNINFNFDQKIQMNVIGNIGTKMKLKVNYNTQSTFEFENNMKLEYTGDEDQIVKKIELGTVSLPLNGTLIPGSLGLFGAKVETQWGKLRNTTIITQQKGERKDITVQGGAQTTNFDISADNYEANRHYFLSGYFRDAYDNALAALPVVNSGVNITRIEVWVVNQQANTQDVRNILAFTDLGENSQYMCTDYNTTTLQNPGQSANPDNENNNLYNVVTNNQTILDFTNSNSAIQALGYGMRQGIHYERVGNARKLNSTEYTYNSRLGFISLKQALNNAEVLAVAYEYTMNGQTFQVGTLSQDGITAPQALVLKMLKASITMVRLTDGHQSPLWRNMMKNVYSLEAFGISPDKFRLDVWYNNPATGVNMNYIPRDPLNGKLLIQVLNLDRIDAQQMPGSDGFFDFVPNASTTGGLIDASTGRIFFPVVEPFGAHLKQKILDGLGNTTQAQQVISQVVFQALYDSTKTAAQTGFPQLNRFRIKGQYQSASGNEISLNAINIPQGAVTVTAGGMRLTEGTDYTVNYNLGKVTILNQGVLNGGQPIKISLESNSMFNLQYKTLLGSRFDYKLNDNLAFGATVMNLKERPLTQKVNAGDDPVNNAMIGIDANFQKEVPQLTKWIDRLPGIQTKEKSTINFSLEAAKIFPGHARAISKDGNAYVDDFEGSQSVIDLRSLNQWFIASTPKYQNALFPEGNYEDSLVYNYNRAKLSWYIIDPLFYSTTSLTPTNISQDMMSNHFMRQVLEKEVFPKRQLPTGTPPNISMLDLSYYPSERGMYNYDVPNGVPGISAGLNTDGTLKSPESRWGGIQRALTTTDFELSNVQFIQFWMMDPFNDDSQNTDGGDLYFNLGNVSEDVLNDSHMSFENGFPSANNNLPTEVGTWGLYPAPTTFNVVNAFDYTAGNYELQDIGLDGLNSAAEQTFFNSWLTQLQGYLDPAAYQNYVSDPSADNYQYFRSTTADNAGLSTLERYKNINLYEGNSNTATPDGYPIAFTTVPNSEDINQDITLNTIESYYQYRVSVRPEDMGEFGIGKNFITDTFETTVTTKNNQERKIRWYQFKVPIKEYEKRVGSISDFRSIRYIRMYMKGFSQPVTLRFARLELVRGEWRKYDLSLLGSQEIEINDDPQTQFNIAAVNIEENGSRDPVPYVVPPGIIREQDVGSPNLRNMNEQALSLSVCELKDGDARAAYRNVKYDVRQYKKLKMYAHVEAADNQANLKNNDLSVFIRLGSDYNDNYYEYEMPMEVTPWYTNVDNDIWPEANNFEISLSELQNLKINRASSTPITLVVDTMLANNIRVSVKGNPNLANITVIMIGVRNPAKKGNPFSSVDDGKSKCAVIWVNELRLSEFDEKSGSAAIARLNAQLADFGNVAVSGNISTPGWGSIEQRVQQRQQETKMGIDASSTLQLGKFFPKDWGVQLPMYVGFSELIQTPRYSPLQPDIQLTDLPNVSPSLKRKSQTFTKRRSINFTNVKISPKKNQSSGANNAAPPTAKGNQVPLGGNTTPASNKVPFYSIDNFSVSYSYNELYFRDINMDWRLQKQYQGVFDYNFSNKPFEFKPLEKLPVIKSSKYLKWLKDVNFYTGVKQIGFRTEMNRSYETSRIRNNTYELTGVYSDMLISTQAQKNWNWSRNYTVKYDLTKNIKADFTANNIALVKEPRGVIDKNNVDWYQAYKDTVMNNLQHFGETTSYNHNVGLSYKLPLDKFPLINFISADVRYGGTFRWDRAPFTQDTLGNTIQNSRQLQLNSQANFENLYNGSKRLKQALTGVKADAKQTGGAKKEDPTKKNGFGEDEEGKKKKEKVDPLDVALRFVMMVRSVNGSYTKNEGMLLPGYALKTNVLGFDNNFEGPGLGFLIGEQNTDLQGRETGRNFAMTAAENGWLVQRQTLNIQYNETYNENWNAKMNLEPFRYLKIELSATRQEGKNYTSFFRYDPTTDGYAFQSPMETGNISASIITWGTAFIKDNKEQNYASSIFDNMLTNRAIISGRWNSETYNLSNPNDSGYFAGYGALAQDVMIPAFIAAYTGKGANEVELNPFKTKAQPNWKITYDGLTKLPSIKKYFKQFNVTHNYRSTLTSSYVTNLKYESFNGLPTAVDNSIEQNYYSAHQISTVTIQESMAPLVGFDMTLKTKKANDPLLKVEYKRDRTVALGLANYQITETKGNSLVLGVGYKITEVPNPIGRAKGSKLPVKLLEKTTINMRCDFTIRQNLTLIRKIEEMQNQVTAGQLLFSIKSSIDMAVSDKLTIRFFYDHQINKPAISTSFPTSNISTGISIRFTLNGSGGSGTANPGGNTPPPPGN